MKKYKLNVVSMCSIPFLIIGSGVAPVGAQSISDAARQAQIEVARQQQLQQLQQQQNQAQTLNKSDFDFKIQRTDKSPVKKALDELEFVLNGIDVDGDHIFDEAETDKSFEKYLGKKTTLSELTEGVENLEERYRQAGYFLSKVYIPPQTLEKGILKIVVIEGYINKINVEGGSDEMQAKVKEILKPLIDKKPLDLQAVEGAMLVLNSFPGYSVSSVLRQGSEPNSSEMFINVGQNPNNHMASINNNSGYSTGPLGVSFNGTMNHLLGRDNQVSYGYNGAVGINSVDEFNRLMSITAKYAEPIGRSGLVGSISIVESKAKPGASLAPLGIETNGQNISTRLSYPLYKAHGNSLSVDSGVAFNRSTTTSGGNPLTFDKSTVFDINLAWTNNRILNGSNVMNFTVAKGLPGGNSLNTGDATASTIGFSPLFTKFAFNWIRIQPIVTSWSASFGMNGQYTGDNLLTADSIVFGGASVGRGYDSGAIAGDKGLGASLEIRKDLTYRVPYAAGPVQIFAYCDYATVATNSNATTGTLESSKSLKSYGIGARTTFPKGTMELQYAVADAPLYSADPRANPRILFLGNYFF